MRGSTPAGTVLYCMMYCTVLYCTVLYDVLYCTVYCNLYICRADNAVGSVQESVSLIVHGEQTCTVPVLYCTVPVLCPLVRSLDHN